MKGKKPVVRSQKSELRPDPRNARLHSDRNKATIRQSLEAIGGGRSILVDGDNIIRAGNGVYEQAQALGLSVRVVDAKRDELIAVRRPDLKGKEAIRAAALDNLAADSSAYDYDAEILAGMAKDDDLIAALVRDEKNLAELLKGATKEVEFQEYDESIADGVQVCKCPTCGHEHAKKN